MMPNIPCLSHTIPSPSGQWCPLGSLVLCMVYKPVAHYNHLAELESPKSRALVFIFFKSLAGHSDAACPGMWRPCSGDGDGGMITLITIDH